MSFLRIMRHVYEFIPFKQGIFSIARHFWQPGDRLNNITYFEGDFDVKVDGHGSFRMRNYGYGFLIENELFWRGLYKGHEKLSMELWAKLCRDSDVILDVGANTGIYSLVAKTVNPKARIFAFEPIKRVYEKLAANVALNNFEIKCFEEGVSNRDGTATIYDLPASHIYSVTIGGSIHGANVETVPTEIKTVRLDTAITRQGLQNVDLIKIDVETHEPEVMEGFGDLLDRFRPTILIEILNDEIGEKVERSVAGKGYLYFNIDDKQNSLRRTDSIRKSDLYNYLLCTEETAKMLGLI